MRKRPRKNSAVWTCLRVSDAVRRETRPFAVSSVEPTGMVWAPVSRTKPLGGLACDARAAPAGSLTKTSPETTFALTVLNATGRLEPSLVSQVSLIPSLSLSPVPQGSGLGVGVGSAVTVTVPERAAALPTASVAVAVAVKAPGAPYAWVTLAPGAPAPSPKVHAIDAGDDQLSLAAAEKGAAPRLPEGSENAVKRGPAAVEAGREDPARRLVQRGQRVAVAVDGHDPRGARCLTRVSPSSTVCQPPAACGGTRRRSAPLSDRLSPRRRRGCRWR